MIKRRYFSAKYDFKTGFLCKLTFFVGLVLLIIFLIQRLGEELSEQISDFNKTTNPDIIIAFAILFFGASIIMYIFYSQFTKLAEIAEEIENSEELEDTK